MSCLPGRPVSGLVLVAQQGFQGVEPLRPEALVMREPAMRLCEPRRLEPTVMDPSGNAPTKQTGAFEHLDVLGGPGQGNGEGLGQLGHAPLTFGQTKEHGAARRVGERVEHGIEVRRSKLNHTVERVPPRPDCQPVGLGLSPARTVLTPGDDGPTCG